MTEREYQRARLVGEVIILNGTSQEMGRAVNISLGGMYFRNRQPRPVGAVLDIAITLPQNRRLHAHARVMRVGYHSGEELPVGIAVKFEGLPDDGRAEIESYVRYNARILKALFFELNRARINEKKVRELVDLSPIRYHYPLDILREKVASELANLKLRAGKQFRK